MHTKNEQILKKQQYQQQDKTQLETLTNNENNLTTQNDIYQLPPIVPNKQNTIARGFAQMFGFDIRVAVLAIMIDLMVFAITWITLGVGWVVIMGAAIMLGIITYKIQKHWYGDDDTSALIKAMIMFLLAAIPVPLATVIAIPAGILGLIKTKTDG